MAVAAKDRVNCCAAAIGTIMIADTRRSPTVRMPITTVTAVRTLNSRLMAFTLTPWT